MLDRSWLQTETAQALVGDVVSGVVSRYRIDETAAKESVEQVFSKSDDLRKVVERETSLAKVMRTRAFKDAVIVVKRNVYHGLRRYSVDSDSQNALIEQLSSAAGVSREEIDSLALEIARSHTSTRERLADHNDFYHQLLSLVGTPETILDVGSGMQPLLFPFDAMGDALKLYVAADKDPASMAAVAAYAKAKGDQRLAAIKWDIEEGWEPIIKSCRVSEFDIAFLFKIIPVVERQKPELIDMLRQTPAKIWVLTGSKISMTKRQEIERRERATLRRFYESSDLHVTHEFSGSEEFCLILE